MPEQDPNTLEEPQEPIVPSAPERAPLSWDEALQGRPQEVIATTEEPLVQPEVPAISPEAESEPLVSATPSETSPVTEVIATPLVQAPSGASAGEGSTGSPILREAAQRPGGFTSEESLQQLAKAREAHLAAVTSPITEANEESTTETLPEG